MVLDRGCWGSTEGLANTVWEGKGESFASSGGGRGEGRGRRSNENFAWSRFCWALVVNH